MSTATVKKPAAKAKTALSTPIAEVHLVPIDLIDVETQFRTKFDSESIQELAADIAARGLMQPILLNPKSDGRFVVIAGERRLRAIKLNDQKVIPALLTKASNDEALLMQLAENIQREELSFADECQAICKLYEMLGSLKEVAAKVKKSVPWCSKRYAVTQNKLDYRVKALLEDGTTEDLELLKAASALFELLKDWHENAEWCDKIRKGEAGRNEIRAALKEAKETARLAKIAAAEKVEKLSHAKPKEPPPPPAWTIKDGMEELSYALSNNGPVTGKQHYLAWENNKKAAFIERVVKMVDDGRAENAFQKISDLIMNGNYNTPYYDIDMSIMIHAYGHRHIADYQLDPVAILEELQCKAEKD